MTATPPADQAPSDGLSRELEARRDEQRRALAERFSFGADGFAELVERAERTATRLDAIGVPGAVLDRVQNARRVLGDVRRLLEDPTASVVPPTNQEIYGAGLDVAQLDEITTSLGQGPWRDALGRLLDGPPGAEPATRALLLCASVCRRSGIAIEPTNGSETDAELTLDGWHVGLAVRSVADATPDALTDAARDAGGALAAAKCPGLIVLDATNALDTPAARVDRDETAVATMQGQIDRLLVQRREDLAQAAGPLAFGLLAGVTMRSTTVSTARVAFATMFRGINLCAMDDPRIEKLAWFLDRFARA